MTQEAKHTPGPWSYEGIDNDGTAFIPISSQLENGGVTELAQVSGNGDDLELTPEDEANARLIAAAPDLLEALENMVQNYKGYKWGIEEASAAIAKARGQS